MAMDTSSLSSAMPMYDPRRSNLSSNQHPKPDSTVPSPPADKVEAGGAGASDTLADLANTEISLDLQGLIDDDHFSADAENLFGDLMDHGGHAGHKRDFVISRQQWGFYIYIYIWHIYLCSELSSYVANCRPMK